MTGLFDNAIRSIQIGLDDYQSDERLVSSVRNLYAGILLLFKYKLLLLSAKDTNAALLKQNIAPFFSAEGTVIWKGIGDKTIDVATIKSRFKSLGIFVEWNVFDRINKHRNDLEHFFSPLPEDDTAALVADCFIIISKFLSEHLNTNAKEALGDEAWEILLYAHQVYDYEQAYSAKLMESLSFNHNIIKQIFLDFICVSCSSSLIHPTALRTSAINSNFYCTECHCKYSYDDICNMGIPDLYINSFWSGVDFQSHAFSNCEICQEGIYLLEFGVCTSCGDLE